VRIAPSPSDVARFRGIIEARLGLHLDDAHEADAAQCLRARLESAGVEGGAGVYLDRLSAEGSPHELRAIAASLTVGETYFFRNPNHFRAFEEHALPDRLAARAGRGPLRILSAGCASGEEAYTLAMLLRAHPEAARLANTRITGIDINAAVLEKARAARYTAWSLRATPAEARERWFQKDGADFVLAPEIRERVRFEEGNLLDPGDAAGQLDVVFCRNVLIYFSHAAACAAIEGLARRLEPGGFLFLGDAENLRGLSRDFHLHHTDDTFYYQLHEQGARPAPSRRPAFAAAPARDWTAAPDVSWIHAIQGASDRIERLTRPVAPAIARAEPVPAPPSAPDAVATALLLLRQERHEEAMAVLAGASEGGADGADLHLLRASLLANKGDVAEARRWCDLVLASDELNAGAHYLLALCAEHEDALDRAQEHDEIAAYLDAGFAMPWLHAGRLRRRRGDAAGAREALARALDLLGRVEGMRVLLFGGGFSREALMTVCRAELRACGEP
jgi:chemotaxis protein methyltransferase CheR